MSSVYSNTNVNFLNRKQLRAAANRLNISHDNSTTNAAFITAIKAK